MILNWNDYETYRIAYQKKIEPDNQTCVKNINQLFSRLDFYPDTKNPKFLSEKLQWLKFNYRNPLLVTIQDKILLKDYIKEKGIDESFYPKTFQITKNISDLDTELLPEEFMIKVNHLSGGRETFYVANKSLLKNLSVNKFQKLERIQNSLHYPNVGALSLGEWWYLYIDSYIFVEEFLEHQKIEFDDGNSYRCEFRMFCFNGEPKFYIVQHDKFDEIGRGNSFTHKCLATHYTVDWKRIKGLSKNSTKKRHSVSESVMTKPSFHKDVYEICRILSEDFPFMRVDFIPSKNGLKINELTPCPSSGVFRFNPYPKEIDLLMGDMLDLNNIKPYTPFKYTK